MSETSNFPVDVLPSISLSCRKCRDFLYPDGVVYTHLPPARTSAPACVNTGQVFKVFADSHGFIKIERVDHAPIT